MSDPITSDPIKWTDIAIAIASVTAIIISIASVWFARRSTQEAKISRQIAKAELLVPHFEIIDDLIDYAVRKNGRAQDITSETKDKCKKSIKAVCCLVDDKDLDAYLQELREFLVPLKDYETMYDKEKQDGRNALRANIKEKEASYEAIRNKHLKIG